MTLMTETLQDAVYALAASGDLLYAARASGLYRSRDQGVSWQNMFVSLGQDEIPAAVAAAACNQVIMAGVKGAVVRSEDAGETWHAASLGSPPPLVSALVLSPGFEQDGIALAATAEDGVFISSDRGETWVPWNFGLIDKNVYALALAAQFERDQIVYAGTESGVFRSTSGGRGWKETAFPMDAAPVLSLGMTQAGRLYAGTESKGLHFSDDAGENWHHAESALITSAVHQILPASPLAVLLEDRLLYAADNGAEWSSPAGAHHFSTTALAIMRLPTDQHRAVIGFASGEILPVML